MSRVPPYTSFWLQPFSTHAVTSLGRLSQRREPDQAVARSDATGEGTAVRCFKRFVMCKITLKKPTGAYFEAGQFVAEHYMKQVEEERRGANYSARLAAALPGGAKQLADPTVLKVRGGGGGRGYVRGLRGGGLVQMARERESGRRAAWQAQGCAPPPPWRHFAPPLAPPLPRY